ncbi:dehydrogenase [Dendrothele bispora CBS 962.96]|uniref:Dehydrogenase n=1 Tax=Dendrothele bispora (strain CBS 962.96) TaxID=1314807 RepID=A0A4S8MQG1_DENBC|nr:dehydrogenase [Dendrothele bispora CBS 962.96]THV05185.1 dehydrogenase [Dendrothele bispora CBS 962.96]
MKACITTGDGKVALGTAPKPQAGPGQILVKVVAAAQNPPDWYLYERLITTGLVIGHDFAGVVEEIGPDVPTGVRKIGEHVAGFVRGGQHQGGAFAEYCVADAELVISLPDGLSFEEASSVGFAGLTACQALWQSQRLPTPNEPAKESFPVCILVWGGSSSVGQYVVQLAKLSGLQVIATASLKNQDLVKPLGADAVFDYRDNDVSQKIREFTDNKLVYAIDCISEGDTPKLAGESLGTEGGHVTLVLNAQVPREDVKSEFHLVYTLFGEAFLTSPPIYDIPAYPERRELGKTWAKLLSELLSSGKLKTTPVKAVPNGLADVPRWIEYHQQGKVSAEKIVYRIADTP